MIAREIERERGKYHYRTLSILTDTSLTSILPLADWLIKISHLTALNTLKAVLTNFEAVASGKWPQQQQLSGLPISARGEGQVCNLIGQFRTAVACQPAVTSISLWIPYMVTPLPLHLLPYTHYLPHTHTHCTCGTISGNAVNLTTNWQVFWGQQARKESGEGEELHAY